MGVRDFGLCTQSVLQAVRRHLDQSFSDWTREWLGPVKCRIRLASIDKVARSRFSGTWLESVGPWGKVWMRDDAVATVAGLLFNSRTAVLDGVSMRVAERALHAWLARVSGSVDGVSVRPVLPRCSREPGRPTVAASVPAGGLNWRLVVQPGALDLSARAKTGSFPLARVDDAIGAHAVRLEARLGSAEVDLGALQDLAVGDILRLDSVLNQPAEVLVDGAALPCGGYVGELDGNIAVELGR